MAMKKGIDIPPSLRKRFVCLIQVHFRSDYLEADRTILSSVLKKYALDYSVFRNNGINTDLTFWFFESDWDAAIKNELVEKNIEFEIVRTIKEDITPKEPIELII